MNNFKKITNAIKFSQIAGTSQILKKINANWGKRYLINSLDQMPGLPRKVSQYLLMKSNLPLEHNSSEHGLSIETVKELIEQRSPKLANEIQTISNVPTVASLSQVHQCTLKSGENVAIKLQFPYMEDEVLEQLNTLLSMFANSPMGKNQHFNRQDYETFLRNNFSQEVDYLNEGKFQNQFLNIWKKSSLIKIPRVYQEFSTKDILVQSYEPSQFIDPNIKSKQEISYLLLIFFFGSFFREGIIHGDFWPSNYGYNTLNQCLVIYDFGSTIKYNEKIQKALSRIFFRQTPYEDPEEVWQLLQDIEFNMEQLLPIKDRLTELFRILLFPFYTKGLWNPTSWNLNSKIDHLLGPEKWTFRMAGPAWFFWTLRSFHGLYHSLFTMGQDINLNSSLLFLSNIQNWPITTLPNLTWPNYKLAPPILNKKPDLSSKAQYLMIIVTENGKSVVEVEMPARSIENLPHLIPDHVKDKIIERKIDLNALAQKALKSNLIPQDIFHETFNSRTYHIYLK